MIKTKSLQRRAIRAVRTIPGFFGTEPILFDLKILNFEDQYKLQLSSLMWDYDHGTIRVELLEVIYITLKLTPQNTVSSRLSINEYIY